MLRKPIQWAEANQLVCDGNGSSTNVFRHLGSTLHMIRGGLILSSGNAAAALLSLARNIVIARLISVEDFGIASTFAITMALLEMASNFSLDRLLVQARDGDVPHFLSTLHAMQAIRGLVGALVLFAAAGPIAGLFGVTDVAWAYQALALVPLLRGLAHLDMFRRQRVMQFAPAVTVEGAAQLLSSLAALPLALWLVDWRAMLFAILLQQLVYTFASHVIAVRPYRWGWDRDAVRHALRFGWPLLLNGLLMFGLFQGDRIIIGSLIGMAELGWFSVAFSLTFMPAMVLGMTLQSFFLPQLAQAQDDSLAFRRLYLVTMQASLALGVALTVAFSLVGPALVVLLYGAKYEPATAVVVLLALVQGLRLARIGASVTATAKANTTNPLYANMVRSIALPIAAVSVILGGGIISVVVIAIAGEAIALLVSLLLLRNRLSLPLSGMRIPVIAGVGAFVLIGIDAYIRAAQIAPSFSNWSPFIVLLSALVVLWSTCALRRWSKALLARS